MSLPGSSAPVVASDEVADALAAGRPVVALESTIIAHGLPRPRNLEVALELEAGLRAAGVTPATVGVVDGRPMVGLPRTALERMASGDGVAKASVRDLPAAVATGASAATTVAATAFLARRAGVRVFATGGLGGVHRGAAATFDESADLPTLARTPITVVCAGVKSILDVAATLERLETLGVTVVGYGTERFPGFYLTESGHTVDWRADDPETVAAMMAAADGFGLDSAIVVANPLPTAEQLDPVLHDRILDEALAEADARGLHGKPVTPFLLDYFQRASSGASLEANIRAVRSNVALAARIARAWSPGR
ncbi:pseudouridine-5'-phosphate glycosidase [Actinomadura viridis]|uniref:Pseudouridine-5'-phosphate glycosidase n=1 Tax=Actinomadura viridis TaxID=58110 RepID=A0A931DS82_9ACTN|nr:pseudouridine-5'-phosphate glycosidase [Actinomadura viridis]MBG6093808.1 pseudouridine-5'-phosphate glycosidase [Actinomadura viridis]